MLLSVLSLLLAASSFASAAALPHNRNVNRDTTTQFASTTTFSFAGNTLPTGLSITSQMIGSKPIAHEFTASNVAVANGFLKLTVPGGQQGSTTITSAQVVTDFQVLYASVRTSAILTEVAGVCNGMFLYRSDNQETGIEWLSDPSSTANANTGYGARAMHYTNQALNDSVDGTSVFGAAPDDATSAVHVYRHDWTAASTQYYIDDVLQQTITTNVPTEAGPWMWNNWANGSPYWAAGPPNATAKFKIQEIVMYYNPA